MPCETSPEIGHNLAQKQGDLKAVFQGRWRRDQQQAAHWVTASWAKRFRELTVPLFSLPTVNIAINVTHVQTHMRTSLSQHKRLASTLGEEDMQPFSL